MPGHRNTSHVVCMPLSDTSIETKINRHREETRKEPIRDIYRQQLCHAISANAPMAREQHFSKTAFIIFRIE